MILLGQAQSEIGPELELAQGRDLTGEQGEDRVRRETFTEPASTAGVFSDYFLRHTVSVLLRLQQIILNKALLSTEKELPAASGGVVSKKLEQAAAARRPNRTHQPPKTIPPRDVLA